MVPSNVVYTIKEKIQDHFQGHQNSQYLQNETIYRDMQLSNNLLLVDHYNQDQLQTHHQVRKTQ